MRDHLIEDNKETEYAQNPGWSAGITDTHPSENNVWKTKKGAYSRQYFPEKKPLSLTLRVILVRLTKSVDALEIPHS